MNHVKNLPKDLQNILCVYLKARTVYSCKTGFLHLNINDRYLIHLRAKKLTGMAKGELYNDIISDIHFFISSHIGGLTEYMNMDTCRSTMGIDIEKWLDSQLIILK